MKRSFAAFICLSSTIVVLASERVFWFWAGFNADSVLFLGAFYLIPTMVGLWALALSSASQVHQVVLAGALYAFVTEGVLTPVVYTDGPLPVLAAMFVGWHGLIAFVGFWYLVRRWLLDRAVWRLAAGGVLFGGLWGVWALASAFGDPPDKAEALESGFDLTVLEPAAFARYALMVGVTLALCHWLIGFVWPVRWRPGKWSTRLLVLISVGYFSLAVLPAVFWAPLKLAAMLGGTGRLLNRSERPGKGEPTILDKLAGRVCLREVAILLLMPLVAASTYGAMWPLRHRPTLLETIYWSLVTIQVLVGAAAFVWAWRRSRATRPETVEKVNAVMVG